MRLARLFRSLPLALALLAIPVQNQAQVAVGVSIRIGPPVLPVYAQPICPGPGFLWIPGYWAYGPYGYYWVPGTWVEPPEIGLLWTPGYWAWDDGFYVWNAGYWGPTVGYYGGIAYGFGYTGVGFYGGYWRGGEYFYNRSVTNVNVTVVRNTYNTRVVNNTSTANRVSFNGGSGGTRARPTFQEHAAAREHHVAMTAAQTQHQQAASTDQTLRASVNHGRPDVAASPRAGQFHGHAAVETSRPANVNRPNEGASRRPDETNRPADRPAGKPGRPGKPPVTTDHAYSDRPPSSRPPNAPSVNPSLEQKHQREMDRVRQQQDTERQKLERQHAQQQQKLDRQRPDQPRQEELRNRQQQQQQQLQQRHDQQTQRLQERQQRDGQKQRPKEKDNGRPPSR
jgi:hypothetical protein